VSPGDFVNDDDFVICPQCSIAMNYVLLIIKLINHMTDLSVLILLDNYIFIPIDFYSMFMFFQHVSTAATSLFICRCLGQGLYILIYFIL
jgi:hypothetical protein